MQLHPGTYPWLISLIVRLKSIFFHNGASVGYYHGDLNALRDDMMELKLTLLVAVPRVF